ncbi:ribbon-helix-helix protein, CopG family [Nonomuraea indica]|uniref:Ribbon-helix-helix protein, CopG family n=1 Tax=Nonomuraea indica TaxID=1581193 RepID=A0ABW8A074_9ACTN|nr:ribbon-helix-helix protein, CopG family [Nonomuraea indica]
MSVKPRTATTIRVSVATRDRIARIARQEGRSMTEVLNEAIHDYERKHFWEELNEQIERTQREDPRAWADYLAERELVMGPRSRSRRIAPEWEGLITFPEENDEGHPR